MENSTVELVNSVGFPILMCLVFAKYIHKRDEQKAEIDKEIREQMNIERKKLIETIEDNRKVNQELLQTNRELSETNRILVTNVGERMNAIENTMIEINQKIK
ncbi:MAG: hypothetical protein KIC47_17880 [Clostridium sp.]|uniref:hypothetical protein n=1 Tax=Clostridium neonatale TaxID=137838 RepID=UPI001DB42AA9|nr:hypothetical protein [Clostridium sp.]CAI3649424.1 Imm [Clostridium neonatale]